MKSTAEVYRDVRALVKSKIDSGVIVQVDWLTTEILAEMSDIEGDDADFHRACAIIVVKGIVRSVIGKYDKVSSEVGDQLTLEGFDHLQKAYTVKRKNMIVLVPIDQLTDIEIDDRAMEYDKMATGCRAHAKELRAYSTNRLETAA